jgi:hypothetical protein
MTMNRLLASLTMFSALFIGGTIQAQDRQVDPAASVPPELWLYQQQVERHDDPKMAVRRNAEQSGANRRQRIASRRWYGISATRPMANPVPFMGTYSPYWGSNGWDQYRWSGTSPLNVISVSDVE